MPRRKDVRQKGESLSAYFERLRAERQAAKRESVPHVMADWLNELSKEWPWDWFGTFTFSDPKVTPAGAHNFFRRYLGWIERECIAQPYSFRADEYGPLGGRFHMHALIGNVGHVEPYCGERLPSGQWGKRCCWVHRWPCGYARILPYDAKLGARYYLTKYVAKASGDWELIGFERDVLRFQSTPVQSGPASCH